MADLFTNLAQSHTDPDAIQPKQFARFEDGMSESNEEPQESLEPNQSYQHQSIQKAPLPDQSQPGQTPADIQTIRDITTTQDDYALMTSRQSSDEDEPIEANHIGDPGLTSIPHTPETELPSTRPIKVKTALANEHQQPLLPKEKPTDTRESNSPRIMPVSPATGRDSDDSSPSSTVVPPTIEVHIGRIELRQAAQQIRETPSARSRFEPPLSLSSYLAKRNGRNE